MLIKNEELSYILNLDNTMAIRRFAYFAVLVIVCVLIEESNGFLGSGPPGGGRKREQNDVSNKCIDLI